MSLTPLLSTEIILPFPPLLHQWNNWHPLSSTLPPNHSLPRRVWRCQCRPDCPWERALNGRTDGVYRHLFLCLADSSSVTWVSIFPLPTLSDFSCTCHIIRFSSQSEFHPDRPWLPKWFFLKNCAYIKLSSPCTFYAFWQVQIGIDWLVQLLNLWEKRMTTSVQPILNLRHMAGAWKSPPPQKQFEQCDWKKSQITCGI